MGVSSIFIVGIIPPLFTLFSQGVFSPLELIKPQFELPKGGILRPAGKSFSMLCTIKPFYFIADYAQNLTLIVADIAPPFFWIQRQREFLIYLRF